MFGGLGVSVWKDERFWIGDDGWTTIQMYRTPLGHQLSSGYGGGFYVVCVFCHSNNMRENRRLCMYIWDQWKRVPRSISNVLAWELGNTGKCI